MKYLLSIILLCNASYLKAQENIMWEERKDPKSGDIILVGPCLLKQVDSLGYYNWLASGADKYQLDTNAIQNLKKKITGYKLVAFGGTWCGDTQELMPRFYKIVKQLGLRADQLDVHWIDRNKRGLFYETEFYEIKFVPTFIVMKGPREVGRIVESISKESLEQELLFIIDKDGVSSK